MILCCAFIVIGVSAFAKSQSMSTFSMHGVMEDSDETTDPLTVLTNLDASSSTTRSAEVVIDATEEEVTTFSGKRDVASNSEETSTSAESEDEDDKRIIGNRMNGTIKSKRVYKPSRHSVKKISRERDSKKTNESKTVTEYFSYNNSLETKIFFEESVRPQRGILDFLFPAARVKAFKATFDSIRRLLSSTFK